jgi:hypothetical protein
MPSPSAHATVAPLATAYETTAAGATRKSGLFDVLVKDQSVLFDLTPDQLAKEYVVEPTIAKGVGSAFAGRAFDAFTVTFVRRGNSIEWVVPNSNFVTPSTEAGKLSLDESVSSSVIAITPILGEDAKTKRVIFAPAPLSTDLEGITGILNPRPAPGTLLLGPAQAGYGFNAAQSYIDTAKAFPENVDVVVNLTFTTPASAPPTVADPRGGMRIAMHYSFILRPQADGYVPRQADDRVGYFVDTLKRLGDVNDASPFVRYITRWDMRKRPVVFYLSSAIPPAYRPAVRRGILAWNAAFARIGMPGAIVVKDQPNDPNWDPDDARYSTVRWITSDAPSFGAYTGSLSDPYTGEIFRAEIVIDGEYLREVASGYASNILPSLLANSDDFESASAEQASFARMSAGIVGRPIDRDSFVKTWLQSVITHEAGHAFGLRHNFAGSTLYSLAQIHDPNFSAARGLSSSVMDYLPVNISPPGVRQGAYFQTALGPYDYWAIKFGYVTTINPEEVARESGRPEYRYGTDDDASGFGALDPRISAFDLSSDPLGYDAEQFALARAVVAHLDQRFPDEDERYYDERLAFLGVMSNYARASALATRYLGGAYTSRTHRGEPGAQPPFVPIPRATARRAFELLTENVFAPDAFEFPAGLVHDLGYDYFHGWGDVQSLRPDFPVLSYANSIADAVLNGTFNTLALGRVYDMESAAGSSDTLHLADLFEWSRTAIFSDVASGRPQKVSSAHRELQRHFVDLMVAYQSAPSVLLQNSGAPREAQALARYELGQIAAIATRRLNDTTLDVTTRAHLEDIQARARRALNGINVEAP